MEMKSKIRPRWKWLLVVAIPLAAILLWLAGVGIFRQATPKSNVIASSKPPATLNTAADFLAQGDYKYEMGNLDQALAAYTRAIELDPKYAEAYNNRAYTYMVQENYASALSDLDKAIELRPDYKNAYINRGDIYNYYYHIDRARAIQDYDMALGIEPHNAIACGHRAVAIHQGANLGMFLDVLVHGTDCTVETPSY